jgi:O-antigen/teichoic acid export membrane protein
VAPAPARSLRAGVLGLTAANALALAAAAGGAAVYSGWLSPSDFAAWAGSLALARAAQLALDCGLKTALVRQANWPAAATLHRLQWAAMLLALCLLGVLSAALAWAWQVGSLTPLQALLWWAGPAAYLLSYPPLMVALAQLERAQAFQSLGRVEGGATLVEFLLPLPLLAAGLASPLAFASAMTVGRALRCLGLRRAARSLVQPGAVGHHIQAADSTHGTQHDPGRGLVSGPLGRLPNELQQCAANHPSRPIQSPASARLLVREGLGAQAVAALSMLRDLQHLWWLGPWWGAAWAGAYVFAYAAIALLTQAPAQTAARVALPALAARPAPERWPQVLEHARWLAVATLPPLALLPSALQALDAAWWQGRWALALPLVPCLALRMVGGAASTPLGAWLMVQRPPWAAARVHAWWTLAEVLLALALCAWLGPIGLAVAGAVGVWVGVALMLAAGHGRAAPQAACEVLAAVLGRPSLWVALALAACAARWPQAWAATALVLPLAWLAEPRVRSLLRAGLQGSWRMRFWPVQRFARPTPAPQAGVGELKP